MLHELGLAEPEFLKLFPENHLEIVRACLENNATIRALEVTYCGHSLLWTCSPVAGQDHAHCYAHDITEKRQAEEQARLR